MYYGRGDYRGGYYRRGDPINLLGALGSVVRVGGALVTGGVGSAIRQVGSELGIGSRPSITPPMISTPNVPISTFGTGTSVVRQPPVMVDVPRTTPGATPTPGIGGVVSRVLPGGQSGYQAPLGGGFHLSRTGRVVRNRRMNVTNPKALRKAIRRMSGFGKLVQRMKRAVAKANTAVGNRHLGPRRAFGRRR